MVSVCLPSDALLQHLPSYLGFSYPGRGVPLHSWSSKAQPLLLTLDEGYLLTTTLPDLQHGIARLGPPAPVQPPLLGRGVAPLGHASTCSIANSCLINIWQQLFPSSIPYPSLLYSLWGNITEFLVLNTASRHGVHANIFAWMIGCYRQNGNQ